MNSRNMPKNYGASWDENSCSGLVGLFEKGLSLQEIAEQMQRTENGVSGQLERMGLIVNRGGRLSKCSKVVWADIRNRRQ